MKYEVRSKGKTFLHTESKTEALGLFTIMVFRDGLKDVKLWMIDGKKKEVIAESE